jgi:hypothetical protein
VRGETARRPRRLTVRKMADRQVAFIAQVLAGVPAPFGEESRKRWGIADQSEIPENATPGKHSRVIHTSQV